jgi:hypothetical protein
MENAASVSCCRDEYVLDPDTDSAPVVAPFSTEILN